MTLRAATRDDVPFIIKIEREFRELGLVGSDDLATHESRLRDASCRYWIIEEQGIPAGHVILCGVEPVNRSVELKRIVIAQPGRGLGRVAMKAVIRKAFEELGAHRLWLDVFEHNARARHVYRSVGFEEEGVLRECIKQADGYASLVVMSILEDEYRNTPGRFQNDCD